MNIPIRRRRKREEITNKNCGDIIKKRPYMIPIIGTGIKVIGRQNVQDFYNIGIIFSIFTPILFLNILGMYAYFQCCAFKLIQCNASGLRDHPVIEFLIPRDHTFYSKESMIIVGATIFLIIFEYKITAIWHEMGHIISGMADKMKITKVKFNWVQPHITVQEDEEAIPYSSRLRIASAGVFHNILMEVTCLFMYHVVRVIAEPYKHNPYVFLWRTGFYNYYYINGGFILNGLPLEHFDGNLFWRRLLSYLKLRPVDRYFNLTYTLLYIFVTSIQVAVVILMMHIVDIFRASTI
mmetsp:Transcript_10395/g.15201  ORF Transcript_10395/g.15201 Transcript_10395/m.15201 type:complete len:294 (+) Transcript_10395:105-986(+)